MGIAKSLHQIIHLGTVSNKWRPQLGDNPSGGSIKNAMIPERYFMWSIGLPIVAPLVLFAVNITSAVFLGVRPVVGTIGAIVIYSGIVGGLPYLLFACVLAWKLRHAPLGRLRVSPCMRRWFSLHCWSRS